MSKLSICTGYKLEDLETLKKTWSTYTYMWNLRPYTRNPHTPPLPLTLNAANGNLPGTIKPLKYQSQIQIPNNPDAHRKPKLATFTLGSEYPRVGLMHVYSRAQSRYHTYIYIHIYIHMHIHLCLYAYTHMFTYVYIHTDMYTVCVYVYVYVHVQTYTYSYICMCTYIYMIYVYLCIWSARAVTLNPKFARSLRLQVPGSPAPSSSKDSAQRSAALFGACAARSLAEFHQVEPKGPSISTIHTQTPPVRVW